jgi:integrase
MSVYKPAKGPYWHYDFVYQGRRFYGSTLQTTRLKAEAVERAKRLAAATGEINRPQVMTLDQAAGDWWEAKGRDLRSAPDLEPRIALCLKLLGKNRLVTEITTADVAEAIRKRRGMLVHGRKVPANATVNRDIIDTLRPILKRAAKLATGVTFPVIDWSELRLKERKPKPRDFSPEELAALDAAIPDHFHDFARFQRRYGCRLSEMFFRPQAVNVSAATLTLVDRKGGDDHIIPLLPEDVSMLAARISRARAAGLETVWYAEHKGKLKPITYRAALLCFMEAMTASGLRETKGARGSHDLRHHAAMQVMRRTGNLRATQRLLGHVSVQSTVVYAHATTDDLRAALEAVSRPIPEQRDDETPQTVAPQGKAG